LRAQAAKTPAPGARDPLSDTQLRKQQQPSAELIEAKARYEAAETALAQLRAQAARERQAVSMTTSYTAEEIASLRTKLERTEAELAKIRSGTAGISIGGPEDNKIMIRPNRMRDALKAREDKEQAPEKKPSFMRDVLAAAAVALIIVSLAPGVTPVLPESWRSRVAAMTGEPETAPRQQTRGDVTAAAETPPPKAESETVAQRLAAVMRDVNLRADPSAASAVISTLARGESVSVMEQKAGWTRVRIGKTRQQGWVASSFLKAGE
jgi:SH3 domain-containing protein